MRGRATTDRTWALLALVLVALVWGVAFSVVKDTLATVSPTNLVTWRFALAALVLLAARPRCLVGYTWSTLRRDLALGALLAAGFLLHTWGMQSTSVVVSAFLTGSVVVFAPLRILFLLLVAVVARAVLHRLITRAVRQATGRRPSSRFRAAQVLLEATTLPSERRQQRIAALGSVAKSAVTFLVVLVTALMVLTEMGFNITTLVAGTSVVAVTVAFGVQNIVKDLISGVFMLMEDQLGVGDWVDMEKASGTVEAIGLRVTSLRDDDGTVWYVRNGEVLRVGTFSQGGAGRPPAPATEPEPSATPG